MKYALIILALLITTVAPCLTILERVATLSNATGVLAAKAITGARPVGSFDSLSIVEVTYWVLTDDVVLVNTVALVVVDAGEGTEAAYWQRRLPDVLVPVAVAETYMTDRTTAFTAAQIEAFVNNVWEGVVVKSDDVIGLAITNVDGSTVRVEGKFDLGDSKREHQAYYIRLKDPNGSVTAGDANIKFERITE